MLVITGLETLLPEQYFHFIVIGVYSWASNGGLHLADHPQTLQRHLGNTRPALWWSAGYSTRRQYSQESTIFLPTKATMLLKTLHTVRPNHHLILADFNSLPDVQIKGRQAPLVTSKVASIQSKFDLSGSILSHWRPQIDFSGANACSSLWVHIDIQVLVLWLTTHFYWLSVVSLA